MLAFGASVVAAIAMPVAVRVIHGGSFAPLSRSEVRSEEAAKPATLCDELELIGNLKAKSKQKRVQKG